MSGVKILINSYNYGEFLEDCINSCLDQACDIEKIIIIDDGSTDGSAEIIANFEKNYSNIHLVEKENGGQASCFNMALDYIEPDDYIFMLDADDIYSYDYVSEILKVYRKTDAEVVFGKVINFKNKPPDGDLYGGKGQVRIPPCKHLTALFRKRIYFGRETSSISMRGHAYLSLFPYPFETDFVTRADDIITWGVQLGGYRAYLVDGNPVFRRVHSRNLFIGREITQQEWAARCAGVARYFSYAIDKSFDQGAFSIAQAFNEFREIPVCFMEGLNDFPNMADFPKAILKVFILRLRAYLRNVAQRQKV